MTGREKQRELALYRLKQACEGIFPEQLGRVVHKAFDLRQRGNYREYQDMAPDEVSQLVDQADFFVRTIRDYLARHVFTEQ